MSESVSRFRHRFASVFAQKQLRRDKEFGIRGHSRHSRRGFWGLCIRCGEIVFRHRSATRTLTMCAFPRAETPRLPSWCRSATQEQPSRLRRSFPQHSTTPALQPPVSYWDSKTYGSFCACNPQFSIFHPQAVVHGSVTGCHGSCHGWGVRKGPSLLICHGVTG
jgi:hypothetical protein